MEKQAIPQPWLVLMAAAALLAGCSPEDTAVSDALPPAAKAEAVLAGDPPVYRLGDRWEYSDGYGLEVTEMTDDGVATFRRTDSSGDWFKRKALFRVESMTDAKRRLEVYRTRQPVADLFPLAMGKKSEYDREYLLDGQELRTHHTLWKVIGQKTIQVPAGTFDCWLLTMEDVSTKTNWRGVETWYYSPKIRNYVRIEYQYGEAPSGSRVLTRFAPGP